MPAFDYSRFDHIVDSDEEKEALAAESSTAKAEFQRASAVSSQPPREVTKKGKEGRLKFEYEGRTVYEWEQSLEEVNLYILPPPGLPKNMIDIEIRHRHLRVGVKDQAEGIAFIDEDTWGPIKPDESMWMLVDGEININLQKMNKAETWEAALLSKLGHAQPQIDPITKEEQRTKMMLERFQEEHPQFDFSNASFNGQVPEARDFLGGVKRTF